MENLKHYVYITTNLINNKQYVGDHSANNLDDNYKGSGILLKRKFKEYGRRNFKRKILEFFDTKIKAYNAQEKYIKKYDTLVPNGYNISKCGGIGVSGCYISEKHKESIRNAQLNRPYRKAWNKGKTGVYSEEMLLKMGAKNIGKKHTKETKRKWSEQRKGKLNGMYNKKHSKESIEKMKLSKQNISKETRNKMSRTKKGIKLTNEHKLKLSMSRIGKPHPQKKVKCEYCEIETIKTNYIRWHGDNCKNKILNYVNEG